MTFNPFIHKLRITNRQCCDCNGSDSLGGVGWCGGDGGGAGEGH